MIKFVPTKLEKKLTQKQKELKVKKLIISAIILYTTILSAPAWGQSTNDYRTAQTGNWNALASWQRFDGSTWVAATATPTSANANVITIRNGHTIILTANVTVDQLVVEFGSGVTVNSTRTWTIANGTGSDLTASGTIINQGMITVNTGAAAIFQSGSLYQHNDAGGAGTRIPLATWDAASTCEVILIKAGTNGLDQSFGNLTWNSSSQGDDIDLSTGFSVTGNFTIVANPKILRINKTATARTVTINGNMTVQGGFLLDIAADAGNTTLIVEGNYTQTGGTVDLGQGNGAGLLSVESDFSHTSGTIQRKNISGTGTIQFAGTGIQNLTSGGSYGTTVPEATVHFTVLTGSTFYLGNSLLGGGGAITSSGSFTLQSGATLGIAHAQGITSTGTTGNVRVTGTRTYNAGAHYVYNGTAAQVTGNGLPTAAITGTVTITNTIGVTPTNNINMSGTLTVDGLLTPTAGQVISGTGTVTGSGTVQVTRTTATADFNSQYTISNNTLANLTVEYAGTSAQIVSGLTYGGLKINNASGVSLGGNATVSGTLYLTSGALTIGSNTLTVNGAIANSSGSLAGSGTSDIFIGGSVASTTLPALTLDNLTVNRANGISLGGDVSVGGTLTLTSGTVVTGSNKLNVTNNAAGAVVITGGSVNGEIERAIAASSTGSYIFANANTSLTPDGSQGSVTVSVKAFPNTFIPVGDSSKAIKRYYTITPSGALTATVRLAYEDSELNGLTETSLSLWRYNGTSWVDEGSVQNDPINNWAEQTDISTWSDWTLAEVGGPLPIQLASFTGTVEGSNVLLEWTTISEVNNYGFYVERRLLNDTNFVELPNSFVPGHGTTIEPQYYSWTNENVSQGTYEYRLRQVDYNSSYTYSFTIEVTVDNPTGAGDEVNVPVAFGLNQNYPNPFNPSTKISFSVGEQNFTTLKVYNILGQEVATLFNGMADAGRQYVVGFDASHLGSGIYFYRLQSGSNVEVRKMTLTK